MTKVSYVREKLCNFHRFLMNYKIFPYECFLSNGSTFNTNEAKTAKHPVSCETFLSLN